GLQWDGKDYSCSYDALFAILYNIWQEHPRHWSKTFNGLGVFAECLVEGFQNVYKDAITLEEVRDHVRNRLHAFSPDAFPFGQKGATMGELASVMLNPSSPRDVWLRCGSCGSRVPVGGTMFNFAYVSVKEPTTTDNWLAHRFQTRSPPHCPECSSLLRGVWHSDSPPNLMALQIYGQPITISPVVKIMGKSRNSHLHLKGIVYHGQFHFTARLISSERLVYFHDGARSAGATLTTKGHLNKFSDADLMECEGRQATLVVYAKI
ncbi:hypothetical protein BV22DRAFT_1024146, partial [Leucogyrophana mollusca]